MPKAQEPTKPTQNDADRAKAEAKALRAEAEALKAKAAYEQDFGSGEGSDATAEAWEKYQQATNAAARAEATADEIQSIVDIARENKELLAMQKAAQMTLQDFARIADIPELAKDFPDGLTIANAINGTVKLTEYHDGDVWQAARDWLEEKNSIITDSDLIEKLCDRIERLIEWSTDHGFEPDAIASTNGREA